MIRVFRILLITAILSLGSCNSQESYDFCTCPECVLTFLPYDNISVHDAEKLSATVKEKIEEIAGVSVMEMKILTNKKLDKSMLNDNKTRFSAKKILEYQQKLVTNNHEIIIGLTNKDISASVRGKDDWGIQGLSFLGGNVCIVSTHRVGKNVPLWKPIIHEFIHTFWNLSHCHEDNPNCLMQDGHGKPKWNKKNDLCETCKKQL